MSTHASTLIRAYLRELADLGYSPHTLRAYERHLTRYAEHLKRRHRSIQTARYEDVVAFRRSIDGKPASQRLALSCVRSFHAYLASTGQLERDVARAVKTPRRRDDEHVALTHTPAMIEHLIATARDSDLDSALVALLYWQAMRVAEVAALPTPMLRVDAQVVTVIGKGRKRRDLWIDERAMLPLSNWLTSGHAGTMYVFPPRRSGGSARHIAPGSVDRRLRRLATRAGFNPYDFNPHSLRHARAEHLRASGVDVAYVSRLLGHTSPQMTAHYMHPPMSEPRLRAM